jgi:hypothetical protein
LELRSYGANPLMIVSVVDFAMLLAEGDSVEWSLVVEFLIGGALGFAV